MVGRAKVPGTCGELVQGRLVGKPFLVTLPVALFSRAEVRLGEEEAGAVAAADGLAKARRAVEETFRYLGHSGRYRLTVESAIPSGKGMASSTADVVAACLAAARAVGRELSPRELAALALAVEPSDGLMYPGFALFDHLRGSLAVPLGYLPCRLLLLDLGGEVDTLVFNARMDLGRLEKTRGRWVQRALELVIEGIARNDLAMLGRGATLSALSYQEVLPKKGLEEIWRWGREEGAVGINAAHSGTVVGLIFPLGRRIPKVPVDLLGSPLAVSRTFGRGVG